MDKIEQKRMSGRIRSKKTRIRKKEYILKLEEKVKKLETENFRLQNLLLNYREENFEMIDGDSKTHIQNIKEHRVSFTETLQEWSKNNQFERNIGEIKDKFDTSSKAYDKKFK